MDAIRSSQILYCPSVEEGVPLPVVEALCGGCSVAGLGTPSVPGLYWAISEGYGSAALNDSIAAHADAVISELTAWEDGRRDSKMISQHWKYWFSSREVAKRIIELLAKSINSTSSYSHEH
jgi:glycosyltransferase involved in cell wall biosynthesis